MIVYLYSKILSIKHREHMNDTTRNAGAYKVQLDQINRNYYVATLTRMTLSVITLLIAVAVVLSVLE